jgi:hypothetical protein
MFRNPGHRWRYLAGGAPHTYILEENDIVVCGHRVIAATNRDLEAAMDAGARLRTGDEDIHESPGS